MPHGVSRQRKAQAGFAFALVCMVVVGIMSYLSVSRLREDDEWARHTEEVISSLRLLLSHVTDGETAQRGFAIAGEEIYLQPYYGTQRRILADLQSLRRLTADNAEQQRRLDVMEPLVAKRMTRLAEEIELRRSQGFEAAKAATLTGVGLHIHDQIRGLVAEMETAEQRLLERRQAEVKRSGAKAKTIIIGGSVLALGVVAIALLAIGKDLVRRRAQAAQAALAVRLTRMGAWSVELPVFKLTWSDEVCAIHEVPPGFAPPVEEALNFYAPEDRETIAEAFGACVRDGTPFDLELQLITAGGRRIWVRTIGEAERNARGAIRRVQGAFQDISERKAAEAETRELAERLTTTLESLTDGFFTIGLDWRFTYVNREAERMFGMPRTELLGNHIWTMFPEARGTLSQQEYERALRDNVPVQFEMFYPPLGVWFDARAYPSRHGLAVYFRDITERRRVESELLAAKEAAEAANRAKSEFLANMSHEIRTPMNGIIGMTELVLDTDLDHGQREFLGMAKSSALSLLGLINDILDFSKIEAGKLDLEVIDFGLRDCIGAMLRPLGMRADQKGIELTADIPADVPDHVIGDPMRLRQILINLTDNAIKFTKSGDVMLRVAVESKTDDAHCLHFSVADTGIGIPEEKQALIFEAFAQADGSTTRTYGGTGLGLAIASQLVRQMGGRMWVESAVGEGTTFHFTARLPVRPTPPPNVRHADPRQLKGLRVLVVDDNAVNRRILREMLANWRMQPALAASGAEALVEMERAARAGTPFPLVILDGMMPEMDGFMVAEKIREHAELSGATIMMLTSAMPSGAAARCGELGFASYLTKPVTQSELLQAILMTMHGAAAMEPEAAPIEQATARLRILLAEDNVINRAVAAAVLEKRGHSLMHAANGREAVEAAAREAFDLIFMDVQMPEMDGFEATRRIRKSEQASGRHTPIAAMTAHAMAGDRERCLAAGMDDYISKPLQKTELLALLERISAGRKPVRAKASATVANGHSQPDAIQILARASSAKALPVFSREKLLDELDDDEELMRRMIALFHENTPRLLDEIRGAIARHSASDLARSAHALLSSLGAFGALDACQLTLQIEAQAHHEDYENTERTFAALERGTAEIHAALAAFTAGRA
jgi:PAS domain S-box-containing protein